MTNVYHAPETEEAPRSMQTEATEVQLTRAGPNSTLERAAANCNVQLGQGVNYLSKTGSKLDKRAIDKKIRRHDDVPEFYRQPFWFVHEQGEDLVVYAEAEMLRSYTIAVEGPDKNKEVMHVDFDILTAREGLRQLLVNWAAARHIDIDLAEFGAVRGFALKRGRKY